MSHSTSSGPAEIMEGINLKMEGQEEFEGLTEMEGLAEMISDGLSTSPYVLIITAVPSIVFDGPSTSFCLLIITAGPSISVSP